MSWAWRGRRALRNVVAPAVVVSLLAAAGATAQAAKPKPDLSVAKAASSGRAVAQGGTLTVSWTVKNRGRGTAAKSTTALVLSTDRKLDARDVRLRTAAQKAVKARKTATGRLTVTVPASLAARRYTLLVCADARNKVKESSERNNCRAATALDVTKPPAQPRPPASPPVPQPAPQPPAPAATSTPVTDFTTTLTASPAAITPLRSARFEFTASQPATGFECKLDTNAFVACSSPYTIASVLAGEHTFEVRARIGSTYASTARTSWRIEFEAPAPGPAPAAAPAPATRATPALDGEMTLVSDATEFLYSGPDPIQKGVAADAVKPLQAAVLRGRVTRRNASPIEGVQVTVLDHPELGRTATRTDGGFDIAVNGGGTVTLVFERAGYIPSQRQLEVPTQDYEGVEEIVMVPYEDRVTGVDLSGDELQVAKGSTITDADGTRTATLLLEPGTGATATLPDGTTKPLGDKLNVRATEFTIGDSGPDAMPGELPPTSAYTYAVEYSIDEASAQGAVDVSFTKPVVTYIDNLIGFPAGTAVPMGYYDREQAQWVPSSNGVVIKLLSEADGRAVLDVTGTGIAATAAQLAALGIDDDELRKLAELYDPGKSLWRAAITHFTPWDYNWPYGLPDGAGGPGQGGPDDGDPDGDGRCNEGGSVIHCEDQTLGEQSVIAGTPYTLVYQSDRVPGRRTGDTLQIPLTGATLPPSVARVDLTISVLGRTFKQSFAPTANRSQTFTFDGIDAYGRRVQGRQKVDIRLDYVYPAVYRTPGQFQTSFAAVGGAPLSTNSTRSEISVGQTFRGVVGDGLQAPTSAMAGWSVDVHHTYDPVGRTLYLGDGTKRSAEGQNFDVIETAKSGLGSPEGMTKAPDGAMLVADAAADVVRRIVPGGATTIVAGILDTAGFSGDGGSATDAALDHPAGVALGRDGAIFISDQGNNRVRRVDPDGKIRTIAGTGDGGYEGDGGPALAATLDVPTDIEVDAGGAVLVIDSANNAVRRIGTDGTIATLAGTGLPGFGGDGGVASKARLRSPRDIAVRADGSVFIADSGNNRVRRVDADGTITTVAGNGLTNFGGDGGPATAAQLFTPSAVTSTKDGGLLIADGGHARLRKVDADGRIATIAGNGDSGVRGNGGPAGQARIAFPSAIAVGNDDTIYFADQTNGLIRSVAATMPSLQLGETTIPSADGRSLYVFDRTGRHLRTVDTLTKAVQLRFGYDLGGRLTEIEDSYGNKTAIQRNGAGEPTAIVAPYGQTTKLAVSAGGFLSRAEGPGGDRMAMEYDAGGLLTKLTDPRDGVHRFEYDGAGRLTKDTAADGSAQTLARTVGAGTTTVVKTSAEGRKTTYRVKRSDDGAVQRTVSDAQGRSTVTVTGTDGVTTVTRPDGTSVTQEVTPDPRFGMQSPVVSRQVITTPGGRRSVLGHTRSASLSDPANPLSLRSLVETSTVNGRVSSSTFDALSRRLTEEAPSGHRVIADVDTHGRTTRVEAPGVTPKTYEYDARGRLHRSAQGARETVYAYGADGRIASLTDPLNRTTAFTYDAAGRTTALKRPDARQVGYSYDSSGNLRSLTPPGRAAHTFAYSSRDLLTSYTPPQLGAAAAPTSYTQDGDELVTAMNRADGSTVGFRYDDASQLDRLTQPRGTTDFVYSAQTGTMTSATGPGSEKIAYTYDGSLPTRATVTGTFSGQVTNTYDDDFRLATQSIGGSDSAAYVYDDDGRLIRGGGLTLARDAVTGLVSGLSLGASTTAITRNAFGEPESTATSQGASAVYGESYGRDASGRITSKAESRLASSANVAYTYDSSDRLYQVRRDGTLTATYGYDDNGNRTSVIRAGDALPTTADYDAQDRMTRYGANTYSYSDAGALRTKVAPEGTTSYEYDALGSLTKATLPAGTTLDYVVDPTGRRIGVKRGGVLERGFLYSGGLAPVAELNANGTVRSRFIYVTRTNVPDLIVRGGRTYRVVIDQVGSPRAIVDTADGTIAQELDYDEFGRVTRDSSPGFQPFGFAGGLYDLDTKLVRFGARDYDPETGRFTAPDPLRFEGGGTNLYVYALNDPVNLVDPTGAFLDIIIDVISIGYDIYKIGSSLMNGCGVSGEDAFALGADVIGAIVPFATGAGAGVRAGAAAARAEKKIVIGEDMAGRVIPEAKRLGADYYDPPKAPPEQWMENNRKWINDRMDEGCTIINCGPAPGRANYPNPTSDYYKMELDEIARRGYPMSPPPK